ncbi:signal peptidase I [Haloarchaeobius baliensis]|uniref:signal peptidase I n=1 Tax=Haloarchaeobius baliensis TaxID=1670458 RepID=UPI003F88455C
MVDARRALHVVGLLVLIVVVVPFVVYSFPGAVGADHSFVVLSGSMEPEIAPGDVVVVDERSTDAIAEGDVITFVRGESGKPVTHRVVGVEERGETTVFTTKGDANEDVDAQPVPAGNVIGEVTVTIPYIGHVIQFAQRPVGFVLLVLLPLGLLGLSEVWTVVRDQGGDGDTEGGTGGGTVATGATAVDATDAPATGSATAAEAGTADEGEITLTATDLTLATGILLLVAPYTVYVALQLRNPVTFTAAFAAGFSFVGVAGLWLTARREGTDEPAGPPDSSDDDGTPGGDADGGFTFDDGGETDTDWELPDTDGSFGFADDDGGRAAGLSATFEDGTAPTGGGTTATSGPAPDADQGDGASGDGGFFDEPATGTEPTETDVFDDTTGGPEEVD